MYPSIVNPIKGIFVHQQIKALSQRGHRIKVICPIPKAPLFFGILSKKWRAYSQVPQKQLFEDVEIYYPRYFEFPKLMFFYFSGKRMFVGINKTVSQIRQNFDFDVIHCHTALPDGYAGMNIAKKYQKPLFITIHGADLQKTILKGKKFKNIIKEVINFSKKTIVTSNKLKEVLNGIIMDERKINLIPNGINLDDIFKGKSELQKQYADKKIILSVSNLVKEKGIDLNLKAINKIVKKYPNLVYIVIGQGTERTYLEKLTKQIGLESKVKFLGQLSHKKIMEYMSFCDIFSLPSWSEGFGIVYLEALANGKPVIACKGEGPEDFICKEKHGLLVAPKKVESLASAIDFIFSNYQKFQIDKSYFLEKYSWEKVASEIELLYV
jgi:glycosyltransferase involved in cell wall biosynthesis